MDPSACLRDMMRAYNAGDYDAANESAQNLTDWLCRGGFAPEFDAASEEVYRAWQCGDWDECGEFDSLCCSGRPCFS